MSAKKIYEAITSVTASLAKEGISKDRKNEAQGYKFRGIDDVYNALAPFLASAKLCILPNVLERVVVERINAKGTALFYVTVKVDFAFVSAEDGSDHHVVTYGEAMDSGDKATNKAMSAAYKYACMQAFCIPTEGDNDADSHTHTVKGVHKATDGAFDSLDPKAQNRIADVAALVNSLMDEGKDGEAFEALEDAAFSPDEKVAIWTFFDSKKRSALKKLADAHKAKGRE